MKFLINMVVNYSFVCAYTIICRSMHAMEGTVEKPLQGLIHLLSQSCGQRIGHLGMFVSTFLLLVSIFLCIESFFAHFMI